MDPALFEKRLMRERAARLQAERLLEEKSRELFTSNEKLREAGEFLENQSRELHAILDHADMAVILMDGGRTIQRANVATEILFDLSKEQILGASIDDLVDYSSKDGETSTGMAVECAVATRKHDAKSFHMERSIAELSLRGQPYTLWLCRDISHRIVAEQNRLRLEHDLAQAQRLEALGVMASGIAHEINTPIQYVRDNVHFLGSAMGDLQKALSVHSSILEKLEKGEALIAPAVSSLRDQLADFDLELVLEELPEALDHASEGLRQISKIVGAVKSFSHPGAEATTVTNINTLLDDTFTVTRNQWKYAADLELSLGADLPEIDAFASELNQVFMNLIVNAAHAIEEAGRDQGRIVAETFLAEGHVVIRITDNGCGIPEASLSKVFDPFFTTKDVGKGTGQGLSFCHQIITQRHKGRLSVTSEQGCSTTFEIHLPIEQ